MKIVITAQSPDIDAEVDPRFGRGRYFLLVDSDTPAWEALANPAIDAAGGAGTQAAQYIAAQGAQAVISGDFGPNAYAALEAAGIAMYLLRGAAGSKARDVLTAFKQGQLEQVRAATGPALHGGRGHR